MKSFVSHALIMTKVEQIIVWCKSAIADGWDHEPTYEGSEPEEYAMKLKREGFVVQTITRPNTNMNLIHVWGPDGLVVKGIMPYDWEQLQQQLRACGYCDKTDVDTQRVGFAGRCCNDCIAVTRKRIETPGWTN